MNLYNLTSNYLEVLDQADTFDEATFLDTLDSIEGEIKEKFIGIAHLVKMAEHEAEVIREEEKRLAQRRKTRENLVERLKQYAQENMDALGIDKVKSATMTVRIQNNPPSLVITDPQAIPNKYLDVVPQRYEVNRERIKLALKAGEVVEGAKLERGRSIHIV